MRPGALTRLPLVGKALTRFGDIAPADGFFSKLTRRVQRHPAIVTLACVVALVALGSPLLTLRLANTSVDVVPRSSSQYLFAKTINAEFPDAAAPRVSLVTEDEASSSPGRSRSRDLRTSCRSATPWSAATPGPRTCGSTPARG